MESDPDLLESFASTDAAAAAAAVREIIPEALSSVPSTHMRAHVALSQPSITTGSEPSVHGTARDTPGTRSSRRTDGDAFGSALLPGQSHSSMASPPELRSPAELRQALTLPLDKLGGRRGGDDDDDEPPPSVGSKRRRGGGSGCGGCMSLSAEMAYRTRLNRTERMRREAGGFFSDIPDGLHWVVATVAAGDVPWLEDLISATPRLPGGCGAGLWHACGGQRGGPAPSPPPVDRSGTSGSTDDTAAASAVADLQPIEERYHYSYAVAAAGGRGGRGGGLFAGMLGKCGLQTLSWDTETQGSLGGGRSRTGGRVGLSSGQEVLTFRSTTESTGSGNSSTVGGGAAPSAAPAAGSGGTTFALRDVHIQE